MRARTAVGLALALAAVGCGDDAFKPGTVVLTDDGVEPALEEDLAGAGLPDTTVDCPATIKVKEGETVACTASGAGGRQSQLTFTFSSADGTIDESSVSSSGA